MSPPASAAACLSSNQDPESLLLPIPPALASSWIPRKATFITCPFAAIAVAAWTRQVRPGGSGTLPEIVFLLAFPRLKRKSLSQPFEETLRLRQRPPPVVGLLSVS